jgi:hypothetical protein
MSLTGVWEERIFAVKENDGGRFYVADGEWDLSGYAVKIVQSDLLDLALHVFMVAGACNDPKVHFQVDIETRLK